MKHRRASRAATPSPVPNRTAAIAALRRRARAGTLLYTEMEAPLRRAVLLYWGGMASARKALGLREPLPARQAWSLERVVDEIRRLHRSGQHMSTSALTSAGRDDLVIAAGRYAGSWARARTLAGVSFKARREFRLPVWDATTVIAEIRVRHRENLPLALSKTPKSLTAAAARLFGSWRDAIEAAGLDYDSILLSKRYDDEALLTWLRELARRRPRMTLHDLDKHGGHTVACRRRWGSLESAAKVAGLTGWPVRARRRAMTHAQVLRVLRSKRTARQLLELASVRRTPGGHHLINSVFHHFATWNAALVAAGVRPRRDDRA